MIAAILLAAGESRRMGTPKPLLSWGGETLVEYQVRQLRDAGAADIVVVLGHGAAEVAPLVEGAGGRIVVNEAWAEGRASSLRTGAAALGDDIDAIVVANVDQPRPSFVVQRVLLERGQQVTVPAYRGERGHPVVVDGSLLPDLCRVDEATQGLRAIVHGREVREVPFDTPLILLDFNTPAGYERARLTYDALVEREARAADRGQPREG